MNTLRYTAPARDWNEALPIGNGRLGAMVFGGPVHERLQLNEETVWSGGPQDADNPDAFPALARIRELLFAGKYAEAQALTDRTQVCKGANTPAEKTLWEHFGCYQMLADLELSFDVPAEVSEYERKLSLDEAVTRVTYKAGDTRITRDCFSSAPDQVLVLRVSSDRPIAFSIRLSRPECAHVKAAGNDTLELTGQLRCANKGGMRIVATVRVICGDGTVNADADHLLFHGSAATILLAARTDYNRPDPLADVRQALDAAARRPYAELLVRHLAEYQPAFARVKLDLGPGPGLPTDECLARFHAGEADNALAALLFQFGRYLLLCSSRNCELPANLQGVWADGTQTPWNCDYHTNINLQMNYWLAEPANLPECVEPLVRLIERMREPGSRTARIHYRARGWTVHTIHNVWGYTSPGTVPSWGLSPSAGAWLCQHLWEHYAFGRDKQYLTRIYPILREAAEFALDWLIEDPRTGRLVSGPATSPENSFRAPDGSRGSITMGPAMDQQIYHDLFTNVLEAAAELEVSDGFVQEVQAALARLAMPGVGPDGRLLEWPEPFEELEPTHRHVSHLFALHPGRQITPAAAPDLARAAISTLKVRGDGGTGWSRAWKICFWARLGDGDHAYTLLRSLLQPARQGNTTRYDGGGSGTYPNLLCSHPPFQIDGNFGATAGIAEMLLQSQAGIVQLLPALPSAWTNGSVEGLRVRGGFVIDLFWRDLLLDRVHIHGRPGTTIHLAYRGVTRTQTLRGITCELSGSIFEK